MKKRMTAALVALFLAAGLSLAAMNTRAAQAADPIQTIRQQYAAINRKLARYKKVKKELSGFSLEGGQLTAYFDGRAIVKLVANHYGESGQSYEEYYYQSGKLIFVFLKDQRYNRPLSGKVVHTEESRFYFENDRMIRWINEARKQVGPDSAEYREKQDEFLQTSSKFLEGVRSKSATIEAEP